ncbi:hypothetical protein ABIE45_004501 [Methylobacterium sp. OAE515]|uniref:hypothetical protein n=1 Tax=Methylobacterium sp. OAE515 TaxID=2817895 RepID=UPI00178A083E
MSEPHDTIPEAVEALRARGHSVEPDETSERWLIDDSVWVSAVRLLKLAEYVRLKNSPARIQ